jgi:hypothetical protein
MNPETLSGTEAPSLALVMPFGDSTTSQLGDVIELDSCQEFQWIVVRTRRSAYDIIVLPGDAAEVMVRGGRFFPEFRRATLAGSTFGGSAVRVKSICVGLHLELHVDGKSLITSRIHAVSLGPPH